ncbi:MAG: glycosyltransferase family 2 protein [Flavobacteriaceae bacterium]|nr:glycosyltransferase family 2 protein [Flavobacteriaceae bacterium]
MKLDLNKNLKRNHKRFKLSALIITLNEADNIVELIHNLDFVDEIIVVDAFSKDGTFKILQKFDNVKVIQNEFKNFSSQRNLALKHASNDWVLFIDGDERVSIDLKNEILNTLENPYDIVAFGFYRKFYFKNSILKFSGYQTNITFRLFNKNFAHYDITKLVHEVLLIDGKTKILKNKLDHFSFKDENIYKEKLIKYAKLKAKELYIKNLHPNLYHFYIKPRYRFIYQFMMRLGFLDGKNGYKISLLNAFGVRQRYIELQRLYNKDK